MPVESLPPDSAPAPRADAAAAFARRRVGTAGAKSGGLVMGYLHLSDAQRQALEDGCPDDGTPPTALLDVAASGKVRSLSADGASVLTEEGVASPKAAAKAEGRHSARVVAWSSSRGSDGAALYVAVIEAPAAAVAALNDSRPPAESLA